MDSEGPRLCVSADHPAMPGHFPGRPIVPGVLILDLVAEDWRTQNPGMALRGLQKMKFLNALAPGERFDIVWSQQKNGKVSFTAFCGDKRFATGQFLIE